MATDWDRLSALMKPVPASWAFQVPLRAGWVAPRWAMTPLVAVHAVLPDSKPGLASFWPVQSPPPGGAVGDAVAVGVGVGVAPPEQVGSPDWAGTLTASHAALTELNSAQLPGNRFLAAVSVQVRYLRYELPEVFISIALYMTLAAFSMPMPVTVELLQVGLTGWPLVGLVPSAIR